MQVLNRLVPLHRGLFEDYVANFWCSTHVLIKWKRLLPQRTLVHACTAATLAALLPSCLHQILRPSRRGFLYCMLNSSLAFFLFSYQVCCVLLFVRNMEFSVNRDTVLRAVVTLAVFLMNFMLCPSLHGITCTLLCLHFGHISATTHICSASSTVSCSKRLQRYEHLS